MVFSSAVCRGCGGWVTGRSPRAFLGKLHATPIRRASTMSLPAPLIWQPLVRVSQRLHWRAVVSFAKRRPFATNVGMSVAVAGASDWLAQRAEGTKKLDIRRSLLMCTFSMFMGVLCFNVYMHVFGRLFPRALRFSNLSWAEKMRDGAGQRDVLKQTVLDLGLWMPAVYFPVFYCFKVVLQNDGEKLNMHEVPGKAMQKYEKTWFSDNTACLGVWIPGDILVFMVPMWLRMPVCYAVSFAWTTVLSLKRGSAHGADV